MRARIIGIGLMAATIAGCTTTPGAERVARLESGMSKVRASAALGAPDSKRASGDREAWLYCHDGMAVDEYVVAWFDGPHLTGWDRVQDYEFGDCATQLEGFDWDDAPAPRG